MKENEKYKSFLLKFGCGAAVLLVLFLFIKYLLGPLSPFIIAFLVAAALQPVVNGITKNRRISRGGVATVTVILMYVLLAGLVLLLLIGILSAVIGWASGLPAMFTETLSPWLAREGDKLLAFVSRFNPEGADLTEQLLPDAVSTVGKTVVSFSMGLVSWASSVGTRLPGAMLTAVICVIATVFFTDDYDGICEAVSSWLPDKTVKLIKSIGKAFKTIIGNYARSYLLIMGITFAEIAIGLLIIGFDYALLIAAIIAVFDILPIVGSGMILLPWTVYKFIQGEIGKGIGLGILYLVVVIARQVFEPKIVGKRVGLHPLTTLIAMWLGLKLGGGLGMFALPITVLIIKDLYKSGMINLNAPEKRNETGETAVLENGEEN